MLELAQRLIQCTEAGRELAAEVVSALHEAGLFRLLMPHWLDGGEANPSTFIEVIEAVARADASTAWCLGQCSVCATVSAYMDADAAREMFGKPDGILAWGSIGEGPPLVAHLFSG